MGQFSFDQGVKGYAGLPGATDGTDVTVPPYVLYIH